MKFSDRHLGYVRGDKAAHAFLMEMHSIVEVWDDLIDKDKPIDEKTINGAFYDSIITLPRNPFYHQHFHTLNPIFEAAILDWYIANKLERSGNKEHLHTSFILRRGVQMLTIMCARIVGGVEWASEVGFDLETSEGQTFAEYAAEFGDKS